MKSFEVQLYQSLLSGAPRRQSVLGLTDLEALEESEDALPSMEAASLEEALPPVASASAA